MRALGIAALVLALAAPAGAAPFGKSRTLGTTPPGYVYDFMFSTEGPRGGVAFFVAGEKQVGLTRMQRLYIARVEGNGRTHALTTTRVKGRTPARTYDGGPPYPYLTVGPRWRMLTTEVRPTGAYGVRLAPGGRRVAAQRLGPKASGIIRTNARGDAIGGFGDGFAIARSAGRFVRAPRALRRYSTGLPRLTADGSLYDLRRTEDGSLAVAHSSGRRWGSAQSVFTAAPGRTVSYSDVVSSAGGDALLVYGIRDESSDTSLLVRFGRRGRPFGPPVELTAHADPSSVAIEAIPGGRVAVRWMDRNRVLHLARASGRGRRFREVASWTAPEPVDFRTLLPLADGRTLLAWATEDRDFVKPDRLRAAVIDAKGRIGPAQTIAVADREGELDGFELRRLGANRAALVWTELRKGKGAKRVRIALTAR
ncbi:MAG TPA: hypothetical protein VF545_03130 [Thermoleophilaceae bacterium]|jgi:hypothetical protein